MDQHFSADIAKYTKSNNILVGFYLNTPVHLRGNSYQKVLGTIISHATPENKNGQSYISWFKVVLKWYKTTYKNARTETEKETLISIINTENISSYEVAAAAAILPKRRSIFKKQQNL
jgi:hypothetical protein